MGTPVIDHSAQVFGRWTVLRQADSHSHANWLCRCDCGTERIVVGRNLRRRLSQSCGCLSREINRKRKGPTSAGWKGGRSRTSCGYVHIHSPNHPSAQKSGYVPEHRLVMEETLGRFLRPEETVHHKNGIRSDNRPENLELWSSRQPKGQRVSDLIVWAKEILKIYENQAKIPYPLAQHIARTFKPE